MDSRFSPDEPLTERAPETGRAALAVTVAIAAMLAGGLFLVVAAPQTPGEKTPQPVVAETSAPQPAAASVAAASPARQEPAPVAEATPAAEAAASAAAEPAEPQEEADAGLMPRLKPVTAVAEATTNGAPAPLLALGQVFRASDDDRPPPFFFAEDINPVRAPAAPIVVAYAGDMADGPSETRVTLTRGENFVDAMRRAGVRAADRNAAASAFGQHQNLRTLRPGQEFVLTTAAPNRTLFQLADGGRSEEAYLLALDFQADPETRVSLRRAADGAFEAKKSAAALTTRLVGVSGRIDGSLYLSAKRVGAPDLVIAALADMFAYDVDFQREIFGGDEFEAIFEVHYDEHGAMVGAGDILYGRLKWRGRQREKGYYRFSSEEGGRNDYFDRAGESARRLLMRTPIDGARLSSGFGTRRHPILGYARAHRGVDFAAPTGTPIKAAGSGTVERADWFGSFGNYVRIRHANGYQTAYAHLNGFARGIRAGARVSQGDIIGYVGTTGRSTGPHLHYEVHHNGQAVNPQTLKMATGVALRGAELDRFRQVRDAIDAMRQPAEPQPPEILAREEGAGKSAL